MIPWIYNAQSLDYSKSLLMSYTYINMQNFIEIFQKCLEQKCMHIPPPYCLYINMGMRPEFWMKPTLFDFYH